MIAATAPAIGPDPQEASQLAQNLARNCGYHVFPCREDKRPACPHGFKQAAHDPAAIAELWRRWPGPLIGIATGEASGISVLDIDAKHPAALAWWKAHHTRLLPTRTYQTRSGGWHLYFRHRGGVKNSQGKLCPGVDTRGSSGYAIAWFPAGGECLDHSPPAPWPDWLLTELQRTPPTPRPVAAASRPAAAEGNTEAILRRVATAAEGERNGVLYWAANRLREHGRLKVEETTLIAAAVQSGLSRIEAERTVASARRRA
jgi:hypothetical protein